MRTDSSWIAAFLIVSISAAAVHAAAQRDLATTEAPGDTPPHAVAGALGALRRLIEPGAQPVSGQSRAQIVSLANTRSTGRQEPGVIIAASKLAVATGDPALRRRVEALVADIGQLTAMGVADPRAVGLIRRVAREALERR